MKRRRKSTCLERTESRMIKSRHSKPSLFLEGPRLSVRTEIRRNTDTRNHTREKMTGTIMKAESRKTKETMTRNPLNKDRSDKWAKVLTALMILD